MISLAMTAKELDRPEFGKDLGHEIKRRLTDGKRADYKNAEPKLKWSTLDRTKNIETGQQNEQIRDENA